MPQHPSSRRSTVREFADLAGVTVKALLHYDRLGLLTPARTSAGHRRYSSADLERLRHILALKQIGIPLTQMRDVLEADPAMLLTRLSARRRALAEERERLRRADHAIALVEESLRHAPADRTGVARLADAMAMPHDVDEMKRYFHEDVWPLAKRFYQDWPAEPWLMLFRDIEAAIPDGPASPRAEELLQRWYELSRSIWRDLALDPQLSRKLHDGFARAWMNRADWPATVTRRFADYHMNDVAAFVGRVAIVMLNRRGTSWFAKHCDGAPQVA